MKSKVHVITVEQISKSNVCVITDYLRNSVYSLGVCYSEELNRGFVGMFNADGETVVSAILKDVNGRRILSRVASLCDITDDDVYAWKCLIHQYRIGANDLGLLPTKAMERGIVTLGEIEMQRKKSVPVWYRYTYLPWIKALQYATRFCDFYKKKGGE